MTDFRQALSGQDNFTDVETLLIIYLHCNNKFNRYNTKIGINTIRVILAVFIAGVCVKNSW